MTTRRPALAWLLLPLLAACGAHGRVPGAVTRGPLALDRVVLYRNGVGYFERHGEVQGNALQLRVRKDQVNDLLKSLAVVDRGTGHVLSVSMPLDPRSWHEAALAALAPGHGRLAQVLDALRGTPVSVTTRTGGASGRIVMVERLEPVEGDDAEREDYRLSLLDGDELHVVLLSTLESISLEDGDVVMQLHRRLDASAGEGMFQQVELTIQLAGDGPHDLVVSYVAEAPLWKPTYRIVLDQDDALLQAWAVVDNVSGEDWGAVQLSLTSGAPLAFRYDLHTPQEVPRPDLSGAGNDRVARVAMGEHSYGAAEDEGAPVAAEADMAEEALELERPAEPMQERAARKSKRASGVGGGRAMMPMTTAPAPAPPPSPAVAAAELQASAAAGAKARRVSGLTRFDLTDRVSLPDGSATMVALINERVQGEQAFLYRPGGSGQGYELNPYRVVRFVNSTDFVLEPGPISIYAGGSFVGEGLAETVASKERVTIPFAVEPSIAVRSVVERAGEEARLVKLVGGTLEIESFRRVVTRWTAKGHASPEGFKVWVRHPRQGGRFELVEAPEGVEELNDAYLVPLRVPPGKAEATVTVVEQTPARSSISIWDGQALTILDTLLAASDLDADSRKRLEPIVKLRHAIGRIDTEIAGLQQQKRELDQRAEQTRDNLKAIKKDPAAGALRARLSQRLEEFTREGDAIARRIVELGSERLERKIELEDMLRDFSFSPRR